MTKHLLSYCTLVGPIHKIRTIIGRRSVGQRECVVLRQRNALRRDRNRMRHEEEGVKVDIQRILGMKPLTDVKSVLCVQPHPDDNEVGAGGTLARLAANGCLVYYVTVTDGRYGGSESAVSAEALV